MPDSIKFEKPSAKFSEHFEHYANSITTPGNTDTTHSTDRGPKRNNPVKTIWIWEASKVMHDVRRKLRVANWNVRPKNKIAKYWKQTQFLGRDDKSIQDDL